MDRFRLMTMFRRVVELSSFSAAAADLDIDGATMSRQIAQLEAELGAKLLLRSTRKVSATAAGQAFYEGCVETIEAYELARSRVVDMATSPRGPIRVSAPMSFGIAHVAKILPRFISAFPDAQIELVLDDHVVDIVGEGFDAAIRIRTDLPDSGLTRKKLAHIRRCIVAAPLYLERHGHPATPDDLLRHNCIEYTLTTSARAHWSMGGTDGPHEVEISGTYKSNNSLAMLPAIVAGLGIGLMPLFAVREFLADGSLVEILVENRPPPHTLCLVHGQSRLASATLRAFSDFLEVETRQLETSGMI